ncbi:hypothetical protein MA16_Dca020659 [Dendrobium catenatum]|uniref:Uncharacterized protein n=1 Tax=Dendrobium catenatum TaxID=906689 RepID=A0A2I0XG70_9ASPA|nr:hypothetical protein MA16_Dca020659 [Dendrobium catenatum]
MNHQTSILTAVYRRLKPSLLSDFSTGGQRRRNSAGKSPKINKPEPPISFLFFRSLSLRPSFPVASARLSRDRAA